MSYFFNSLDGVLKMDFLVAHTPMMLFCLPFTKNNLNYTKRSNTNFGAGYLELGQLADLRKGDF